MWPENNQKLTIDGAEYDFNWKQALCILFICLLAIGTVATRITMKSRPAKEPSPALKIQEKKVSDFG